ncbi:MAG: SprT family zinc-dependent metalloprotease [Candidatus Omnitrophota bacterium]
MLEYNYKVCRIPKRKSLSISISANNIIEVRANKSISEQEIKKFLYQKQRWIQKTLHFNQHVRKPYLFKNFIPGEKFLYLGKEYSLFFKNGKYPQVQLQAEKIVVNICKKIKDEKKYTQQLLTKWYKNKASKLFKGKVLFFSKILNVKINSLTIKTFRRSWGNCSFSGNIRLNWRLVMCPVAVIDYVIVHELCHLIHHNHSQLFWQKLKMLIPEYKNLKAWLIINENMLQW